MPNIGSFPDFSLDSSLDYSQIGLPSDSTSNFPPPGLESTSSADPGSPNIFGKIQSIWDNGVSDAESAVQAGYSGLKNVTSIVYGDAKAAVGTVAADVVSPVKSLFTGAYTYLILGLVVVGGVIYFAGKSGALRVSRVV